MHVFSPRRQRGSSIVIWEKGNQGTEMNTHKVCVRQGLEPIFGQGCSSGCVSISSPDEMGQQLRVSHTWSFLSPVAGVVQQPKSEMAQTGRSEPTCSFQSPAAGGLPADRNADSPPVPAAGLHLPHNHHFPR